VKKVYAPVAMEMDGMTLFEPVAIPPGDFF